MDLHQRVAAGDSIFGTFVGTFTSPAALKVVSAAGLDFIILDLEHTAIGWSDLGNAIAYARAIGLPPLVRIPRPVRETTGRVLDIGAVGIVFPRVETADDVRKFADLVLYPPSGNRAVAFGGGHNDFLAPKAVEYVKSANARLVNMIQIETVKGMQNLDAICSAMKDTGCATILEVSRADLTTSMGVPMQFDHPDYVSAVQQVLAASQRYGLVPSKGFADLEDAGKWLKKGVRVGIFSSDLQVYRLAWNAAVGDLKKRLT